MQTLTDVLQRLGRARPRGVFYGWWIVGAWFVLNIYWAGTLIYGLTVFFTPVRVAFGWDAALLTFIFSLANILTGLLSPLTGALFDRVGPRPLMLFASGCGAAGLVALGRTNSLPGFIAAFSLVSLGFGLWSGLGMMTAGLWFVRRRGLAMGVIFAGSAIGGLLVPVWQRLVTVAGWRTTFGIAGVAMLAISVLASLVLRHRPADLGLLPDGDSKPRTPPADPPHPAVAVRDGQPHTDAGLRAALRTWQFWALSAITSVILAGSTAATVLLLPRLEDAHVDPDRAVTAATAAILLGAVARPLSGFLADRLPVPTLAALIFGLQAIALAAFAVAPSRLLLLFVVAFGLSNDIVRVLASLLLVRYYGPRAFGRILGMHQLVALPGRVAGPVLAGALHDGGHGYGSAFLLFALLSLGMIVPVCLLRYAGASAPAPSTG